MYRLISQSLNDSFSHKTGIGIASHIRNNKNNNNNNNLDMELVFVWINIDDIVPIRSMRCMSYIDTNDSFLFNNNINISNNSGISLVNIESNLSKKGNIGNNVINNNSNISGNNGNISNANETILHQMNEISSFDFDLLILNCNKNELSIHSGIHKLCNIELQSNILIKNK